MRTAADVDIDFDSIRSEAGVPASMPAAVVAAAEDAVRSPSLPELDRTDLPLVTIDPPGSTDLDQAVAIEADSDGWMVRYAIADVGAWVEPGGVIDRAARERTQTFYAPDFRTPLHPAAIGERAASLLPDGPRPAVLWSIGVAADGSTTSIDVRRAMVRSRAQLTYEQVQASIDEGAPADPVAELPRLGRALLADARRRGAIDLGLPEQQVTKDPQGRWTVTLRRDLPVETWNAQISLLTGRAAASLMIDAGIGILRTLPPAPPEVFPRLRRAAANLGIGWGEDVDAGALLAGLDMADARHAAFADLAAELLRGAGYHALVGSPDTEQLPAERRSAAGHRDGPVEPDELVHAGIGGPYSHVTAPLRRLVDRFASEVCLAISAGDDVPGWAAEALEELPASMQSGNAKARKLDRMAVDAAEAFVLTGRVGEVFHADVVEAGERGGTVAIADPAIRARCDGDGLPLGGEISVRCIEADLAERRVRFEQVA